MKKSIRDVAVLIMLVAMMVPATAYGAEKPCCKDFMRAGLLQINKTQIQDGSRLAPEAGFPAAGHANQEYMHPEHRLPPS